jgi:hypothetical protein
MADPSWRQLAGIPESSVKAAILSACGIEPPAAGISDVFIDRGLYVRFSPSQDTGSYWIVSRAGASDYPLASTIHADGSDALRAAGTAPGTPLGTALRAWMRSKGWRPLRERAADAADPTTNTRTII